MTAESIASHERVLCVGDTTYLDYRNIIAKREGYGPQGNGGNGLLLHSGLAISPEDGQALGLLWQKLWNREHRAKPPVDETPAQRKKRQAKERKAKRNRAFEEKESYRWVEAIEQTETQVDVSTRLIHIFDREGDIAEVFDSLSGCTHSGVVVRAAHNRSLEHDPNRLWPKLENQPIVGYHEVELAETKTRKARRANLAVRFCALQLRAPSRLGETAKLKVYAVYAHEVNPPEGEEPVSWMLLTSEPVTSLADAKTILRWYTYRWRVEEYHKVLKSGTQVERYRLAACGMKTLLGFLSVIAVDLLRLTYLHRTQPETPAEQVLSEAQIKVLQAKTLSSSDPVTIGWAVGAIARLGGYLDHRRNTPIGIQVLWRGWAKLQDLVDGWQLAQKR